MQATFDRSAPRAALLLLVLAAAALAATAARAQPLRDVAYGDDPRQRFDVYPPSGPPSAALAPVIFMVHGGAWVVGDKAARGVVQGKLARWMPRGLALVSVNYRMLPQADPLEQARDVARALAAAQRQAAGWGADGSKFILMGHSAGAHLVALLAASPTLAAQAGTQPWLATVALDSAALDVPQIMQGRHMRLYDRAFGADRSFWTSVSPYHQLARPVAPMLLVCSTLRGDSCPQARHLADRAAALGSRASVLEQPLSHADINQRLGEEPAYTAAVEAFLGMLDPALARLLAAPVSAPATPAPAR